MNAIEHLEQHLGQLQRGWSPRSSAGVQVCAFENRPQPGVTTLATLGLSDTVLAMKAGRSVRQELLLAAHASSPPEHLARGLLYVAERVQAAKRALLRGDVFPLGEELQAGSPVTDLYSAIPVLFPEGLATLRDTEPATVFVWLLPVLPAEAAFIASAGWSAFEDRLEAVEPDLFDLKRKSIV